MHRLQRQPGKNHEKANEKLARRRNRELGLVCVLTNLAIGAFFVLIQKQMAKQPQMRERARHQTRQTTAENLCHTWAEHGGNIVTMRCQFNRNHADVRS